MSTSNKAEDTYSHIDCSLHDQLEVLAIQRKIIAIKYNDLESEVKLEGVVIKTSITRGGEEFLKLASGLEIRLDRLLIVDDLPFKHSAK